MAEALKKQTIALQNWDDKWIRFSIGGVDHRLDFLGGEMPRLTIGAGSSVYLTPGNVLSMVTLSERLPGRVSAIEQIADPVDDIPYDVPISASMMPTSKPRSYLAIEPDGELGPAPVVYLEVFELTVGEKHKPLPEFENDEDCEVTLVSALLRIERAVLQLCEKVAGK